jgi:glycosyltransferase involved in cell wall biosynthesis
MVVGKVLAKMSFMVPDMIVTISELAAKYISKEYKPRVAVYGIPMGVDRNKFPKISKDHSRESLINNKVLPHELLDKFIVLYAGAISNNQRIENLAFAAEKLKAENENDIAILIIGEGDEKQNLQQLKLQLHLDNFYILPSQPRDTMPIVISSADSCTIQLSFEPIFDIALPTKFFEYIASGKPMIGICRGELANIINSNDIGRTVNFGDIDSLVTTIRDFKNSPNLMQTMKNNCYRTVERFSLDSLSSELQYILRKEMSSRIRHKINKKLLG